ncbi:hypothetical protein [Holdemania massiliensis]|uniref:hypothetical protein n=1 Tax=Holdemania massiliensis TaxID=1468449 RepID=UPI001F067DA5|nr:hypothetical protein [Holdemania massiliensis]MCH1939877.1 hypothetical protein [Holdemania massiliensis]
MKKVREFLYNHGWSYYQVRNLTVAPLCFLLFILATYGFTSVTQNQSFSKESPQVIPLSDFGLMDEIVEKKRNWIDGLGNQRYECILQGVDPDTNYNIRLNINVVDYQEEINPVIGYLREMGISVNQNSFRLKDLRDYLEDMNELDADLWKSEMAYSSLTFDIELSSYGNPNNTIYLLSGNRAVVFRYYDNIEITQDLIDCIVSIYDLDIK